MTGKTCKRNRWVIWNSSPESFLVSPIRTGRDPLDLVVLDVILSFRDISGWKLRGESLCCDFTSLPSPQKTDFFHVNQLEEIFIPLEEGGQIVKGDGFGDTEGFAAAFLTPYYINFDPLGRMYIADTGNGLFKIVHPEQSIPSISGNCKELRYKTLNGRLKKKEENDEIPELGKIRT